jgi:hypothetical protein
MFRLTMRLFSSSTELEFDNKRLGELNEVSRLAREARHKLSQNLRMARNTEDDLRSKYGSLRASMKKSKLLVNQVFNSIFECLLILCIASYNH